MYCSYSNENRLKFEMMEKGPVYGIWGATKTSKHEHNWWGVVTSNKLKNFWPELAISCFVEHPLCVSLEDNFRDIT